MSLFDRVLQKLLVLDAEADTELSTSDDKLLELRHKVMFILPFWNSRPEGYWEKAGTSRKEKNETVVINEQYSDDWETFVDYWRREISCSTHLHFCTRRNVCLWHRAIDFYSCNLMEEEYELTFPIAKPRFLVPIEEEYNWIKFTGLVQENLEYVQRFASLSNAMKDVIRTISEGLGILRSFRKLMARWNFEDMERIKAPLLDCYQSIENLPRGATHIFAHLIIFNRGEMCEGKFSNLEEKVKSAQLQAKAVYLEALQALTLDYGCNPSLEYEVLHSWINDLQDILKTSMGGLTPSPKLAQVMEIVLELEYIKSVVGHASEEPVESEISYFVAAHIDVLATQASDALHVNRKSEILDLNTIDGDSTNLLYAEQMIMEKRNNFRKMYSYYDRASECIDYLVKYAYLIDKDNLLGTPLAASYMRRLQLFCEFMYATEDLLDSIPELIQTRKQIAEVCCGELWDLRSLCFRNFSSNRKDFPILSIDFLKRITKSMPPPNALLVYLIESFIKMGDAELLLDQLRKSIVPTEEDERFANMLYSRESNLAELMDPDAISCLIRDVNEWGIESAHIYVLFFRKIKDDISSRMVETVEGFKTSVRQAYAEFLEGADLDLPKSELEFFDTLMSLAEIMESDAYFSANTLQLLGVVYGDLVICGSLIRLQATRQSKPEEVKRLLKLGQQVYNILTSWEIPYWFLEVWLSSITEEVELIKEKISRIDTFKIGVGLSGLSVQNKTEKQRATECSNYDPCTHDEDQILVFDEQDTLMTQLTTGSEGLKKISIVGMPGLGKTTLARNLYKGCAKSFHAHAWCHVGKEFHTKELLSDITSQISERPSSEINNMLEEDLKLLLKQSLSKKSNYLIVLDDVWDDVEACKFLQKLPVGKNGNRILLTSRSKTIGVQVCGAMNVIELQLLSPDKSWNLLQMKVFGTKKCPQNLSQVGEGIAEKCGGLPLSLVLIAGVLKNKENTEESWCQVAESLDTYLANGVLNTLELSYTDLSVGMKQCFLYCITFLKGKEIPRSKLVQIWLAERFVEKSDQQKSLEAAAEEYLRDLVDRSLLMVAKIGSDNRIQTCRIHDLLRDFCIQKAKEENFIITINRWGDLASRPQCRRLCFCSPQCWFEVSKPDLESARQTIRSLTTSADRDRFDDPCDTSFIIENFKSLTLLDLENLAIGDAFYGSVAGLELLRYLAIRGHIKSIPSSIGELLNLETLIVKGERGEVEVPESIFKLSKLRHLVVNRRARVSVEHTTHNSLSSLQSFSTLVLSSSTGEQIIIRLPNLRKLRCIFLEKSSDLSILDRLCHLESLKVFYYGLNKFSGKLSFPSSLCKLTLYKFRLPWSEIEKIATLLPRLEILKLLFKAFEGHQWTPTATFGKLKYLRMEELDIEEWEASDDNFPLLERLVVRRCKLLHGIPEELGNIGDLKGIEAHWCKESVAKSVLKIKKQQSDNMELKIIVYPSVLDLDDDDDDDDDEELSE